MFWVNYINACRKNIFSFIFGVNIRDHLSQYFYYIPPHLHNSFLTYYGMFGIFIGIIIIYLIIKLVVFLAKNNDYMLLSYIAVFLIRSFVDIVFANYCGDIVLYIIIFTALSIESTNYDSVIFPSSYSSIRRHSNENHRRNQINKTFARI